MIIIIIIIMVIIITIIIIIRRKNYDSHGDGNDRDNCDNGNNFARLR